MLRVLTLLVLATTLFTITTFFLLPTKKSQAYQNLQIKIIKRGVFTIIPPPAYATKLEQTPQFPGFTPVAQTPTQNPTPTPQTKTIQIPVSLPSPTPSTQNTQTNPTPTPNPTTTMNIQSAPIDDVITYIMNAINDYRTSLGLSKVTTDSYTCNFAKIRAAEITQSFNHDGFTSRVSGHTLPYPSYSKVTENIAMNSDYQGVVPAWIASPGHAENMRADTPYVCVEKNGNYYAYEGWRP